MYTGIVQGLEKILDVRQGDGFSTLVVSNTHNFFHDVFIGASVAINGTCLTATRIDLNANQVHFDVSDLTRRLTTLGTLQAGDEVNIVKLLYYSYKIRKKLEITHRLSRSTILYAYV